MSCGVGHRRTRIPHSRLWCRPAAAALIRPLAWEPPYAAGTAQEMAKRQKNKQTNKQKKPSYLAILNYCYILKLISVLIGNYIVFVD